MPSIRQLSQRIKSVKTTAKITGAMQAVAAMRLRKYNQQSELVAKYGLELKLVLNRMVLGLSNFDQNPLLQTRSTGKTLVIIVAPSRGFCGGLHRSVVLNAYQQVKELGLDPTNSEQVEFITLHKPAYRMMTKLGGQILAFFNGPFKDLNPYKVLPVSELIYRLWADKDSRFKDAYIAYAEPTSSLKANLHFKPILPLDQFQSDEVKPQEILSEASFLETDIDKILAEFLPQWLEMNIHLALVQTMAAEEGARMIAMSQASDNAGRLADKLKLVYYRQRQAKITQEISEIVGGSL
jgi:F-type H+-transporting ATPase subunit gamma